MKLYIDTSNVDKVVVGFDGKKFETEATSNKSQKLLPFIEELLKKNNIGLKDIKAIEVNTGPGSYTGLRVGVSVAKALAWTLDILVNGKNMQKGENFEIRYS